MRCYVENNITSHTLHTVLYIAVLMMSYHTALSVHTMTLFFLSGDNFLNLLLGFLLVFLLL